MLRTSTARDLATSIARVFSGDVAVLADPYPLYRELQACGPMHWLAGDVAGPAGNAWHVLGYDETALALKERRFGAHRMPPPATGPMSAAEREAADLSRVLGLTLLYLDPPDHTRLRLLAAQTFTRRIGDGLRPLVRRLVDDLLDRRGAGERWDVMADLAVPLPTAVVAELLGIPRDDRTWFARRTGGILTMGPAPEAMANLRDLARAFRALASRRRGEPGDDLLTDLVRAQRHDDVLSDDEIVAQCLTVVVAGTETTAAAIGSGLLALLRRPAIWSALDGSRIAQTVDELLRFDGPTHLLSREARADVVLGGAQIETGQRLWLWLAAANRDPTRFPRADELLIGRADGRHLAFGSGPHACIGAALARLEMEVVLGTLRDRYPALGLAEGEVDWLPNPAIRTPRRLVVSTG